MKMRHPMLLLAGAALSLTVGCDSNEEVLLGNARLVEPDASDDVPGADAGAPACFGQGPWSNAAPRHLVTAATPVACDVPVSGEITVLARGRQTPAECDGATTSNLGDPPPCWQQLERVIPLADGTAWVLGYQYHVDWSTSGFTMPRTAWLAHVSSEAELIGETLVPAPAGTTELTFDDHGVAWLSSGGLDPALQGHELSLQRYDANVQPLGAPLALEEPPRIARLPGVGVVLLTTGKLTALDFDGNELWSKTDPSYQPTVTTLASGTDGIYLAQKVSTEPSYDRVRISALDANGDPTWNTESTINAASAVGVALTSDAQDKLALAVTPPDVCGGAQFTYVDIESFSAEGVSQGALRANSTLNVTTFLLADGRLAIPEFPMPTGPQIAVYNATGTYPGVVAVWSADRQSCARFSHQGLPGDFFSVLAPNGDVWLWRSDAFARVRYPSP